MATYTHGICSDYFVPRGHLSLIVALASVFHTEMDLSFKGGCAGAQVSREFSLYRSHSELGQHNTSLQKMRTTCLLATARAAPRAGGEKPANLDDRDYPTRRNDDFENDHDNENYDTNCYGRA